MRVKHSAAQEDLEFDIITQPVSISEPQAHNVELGSNGRHRSNVWKHAGANSFSQARLEEIGWHPTVKPAEMISDILKDASAAYTSAFLIII